MRIQVKTLTGKTAKFDVEADSSVSKLSELVENTFSVPIDEQKLIFNGKLLEEGSFMENGLKEEGAVYMIVAIEGGKGKKKKKKSKKPKPKHKKKKVKLAILNYYKVEDGTVTRLRQRSPSGTFMAEHSDRYYCGRTHITYKKKEDKAAAEKTKAPAKAPAKAAAPEKAEKGKKGKK